MKRWESILPFFVLLIVSALVIPLPAAALDLFLSANLIFSVLLLLTALTVSDPLKLSTLPMLLLMATLFRLSLNISTTRAILTHGHGGELVSLFGNMVIAGSLVVGVVIFLIITLVQFVVIAKGGERVAEVSARFALDALPGKQMSIDADVRAGLIDFETARKRRQEVQLESRLYGALDGAMKFVKGDAIAGIFIAIVNGFGGVLIGVLSNGLTIKQSLATYTLLTVGDGLLSQIPSFLNALAAGLIVTRVGREGERSATVEMVSQVLQCKKILPLIGVLILAIAPFSGVPTYTFVGFGVALLLAGLLFNEPQQASLVTKKFRPSAVQLLTVVVPEKKLAEPEMLLATFEGWREKLFSDSGILVPTFEIKTGKIEQLELLIRGVKRSSGDDLYPALFEARAELLDDITTRRILDFYDTFFPELITTLIPSVITITQLTMLLRALTAENVSIKNIDVILQAIAETAPKTQSQRKILEEVRFALRHVISASYTDEIKVLKIDPLIEFALADAEREEKLLDSEIVQELTVFFAEYKESNLPIVVSKGARALLRDYLHAQGITNLVIAEEELVEKNLVKVDIYKIKEREQFIERLAA